uniref:Uncharacterized protein n=1 Tax=viral metagenome TaxID=1070528 RepID=A0A2V0RKP4_9ZZZZ
MTMYCFPVASYSLENDKVTYGWSRNAAANRFLSFSDLAKLKDAEPGSPQYFDLLKRHLYLVCCKVRSQRGDFPKINVWEHLVVDGTWRHVELVLVADGLRCVVHYMCPTAFNYDKTNVMVYNMLSRNFRVSSWGTVDVGEPAAYMD